MTKVFTIMVAFLHMQDPTMLLSDSAGDILTKVDGTFAPINGLPSLVTILLET